MLHGNSSSVTDQISPPNPYHDPPLRPLDGTRATQQHLQGGPILYPQTLQHTDQSPHLTPQTYYSQSRIPNYPRLIQPYGPPPRQTSQHPPLPLVPHPALHHGVQQRLPQRPTNPPHPANSHPQFFPSLNQIPQFYCQPHNVSHHVRANFQLNLSQDSNTRRDSTPPVQPYLSDQSVYAHVNSSAQQSLLSQRTSTVNFATVEPTTPHSTSALQPTSLSDNSSAESRSPLTPDTPDPKRVCLSLHCSTTTATNIQHLSEMEQPELCMASLSPVASECTAVSPVHLSNQQHTYSESSTISNVSPSAKASPRPTFSLVFETLFPICSEWHNFGLALGLLESTLKRIKHNDSDCKDCLRETLAVRINDKPLTWRDVIRALKIVTVNNNELAMSIEREYSDQLDVQILMDSQEQSFQKITSTAINIPDCVVRYASYLKDKYKRMPVLPDTWPPPLVGKDHFTNLALIERRKYCKLPQAKSKHSIEYDYAYGNVDNIVERKQPIKLENLFEPLLDEDFIRDQFIVLMNGAPGVGKTTISRKICIDWSKDKLKSNFHFVILIIAS